MGKREVTKWSVQQEHALKKCAAWIRSESGPQVFYLAGYAGTGKTTLAKHLVNDHWLFAAYTGKASHVLRQKGCYNASTIHSLIYRPSGESKAMEINELERKIREIYENAGPERSLTETEKKQVQRLTDLKNDLNSENKPRFTLWANSPLNDYDVEGIVIDEVSMVDERLGKDLESFGKKILVLGDPAQLPPVGAGGYFTKREPDIMLTEVHRHARESGILRLATHVRENGYTVLNVCITDYGPDVHIIRRSEIEADLLWMSVRDCNQVLCGLNASRFSFNKRHRERLGMLGPCPQQKDRLVCLRNDHQRGLFNGSQWIVEDAVSDLDMKITDLSIISEDVDGRKLAVEAWMHHLLGQVEELQQMGFGRRDLAEFDWSYALTVHKAQGSQWEQVVLFDESRHFRKDAQKWLYTGITRASKGLLVIT